MLFHLRPRLAAVVAPVALAAPTIAFAVFSARAGQPGAAVGVVAGALTGVAFTAAVMAWSKAGRKAKGASTMAAAAALATAAAMTTAFDGRMTMSEGRLMVLFTLAILLACWRTRPEPPSAERLAIKFPMAPTVIGAVLAAAGAIGLWAVSRWAVDQVSPLAGRRADGDLEIGLAALGLAAAAPSLIVAWRAACKGDSAPAQVEVTGAAALGVAGGLGAAALVSPLAIPEAFMGWPAAGLCLGAVVLVALASATPRPVRHLGAVAGLAYLGLLAAFARSAG